MMTAYTLVVGVLCLLLGIMWHHRDIINLMMKLVFSGIAVWSLVLFLMTIL